MGLPMRLPAEARLELMRQLSSEIYGCKRCRLWEGRRNPVPGEGDVDSKVFFVGEAPGRREDETGRPFAGAAGRLLDDLLRGIGLSRNGVYIGNVVKCRPPGNRPPRVEEVEACYPYLERQFRILEPRVIVSMGNTATTHLMTRFNLSPKSVGEIHGRPQRAGASWGEVIIFPSYHPASALYMRGLGEALRRDFAALKGILDSLGFSHD
jgi:DNA polymerase